MVRSGRWHTLRLWLHLSMALIVVLALTLPARPAHAATLLVTNTNDDGAESLRGQIAAAGSGGVIDFAPALAGQTIFLTQGQIIVTQSLTIQNTSGGTIT